MCCHELHSFSMTILFTRCHVFSPWLCRFCSVFMLFHFEQNLSQWKGCLGLSMLRNCVYCCITNVTGYKLKRLMSPIGSCFFFAFFFLEELLQWQFKLHAYYLLLASVTNSSRPANGVHCAAACCWRWHVRRGFQQRRDSVGLQHQEEEQSRGN